MTPREAREAKGMTQLQVAAALGVSISMICLMEMGAPSVSLRLVDAFEELVGVRGLEWPLVSAKTAAALRIRALEAEVEMLREELADARLNLEHCCLEGCDGCAGCDAARDYHNSDEEA